MYIARYKPWNKPHVKFTEENDYVNRRQLIKSLGILSAGMMATPTILSACNWKSSEKSTEFIESDECDNCFSFEGMDDFYPAKRNEKYKLDRPMTREHDATHYNNFYEFIHPSDQNIYNVYKYVEDFDNRDWKIEVKGLAENTGTFYLEELIKKFGTEERIYRFRCVERWSMAVPWTGFSLADLIKFLKPQSKATHIKMTTFSDPEQMPGVKNLTWYPWPYFEGLRMDEAMNELSFIATGIYGKPLPKQNGAPIRLVVPWKYGYKNIKSIIRIEFVNYQPPTFWNKLQPKEYPFISNVNPEVPHPRWSQQIERMIPDGEPRPTIKYNGYGEYVASMYK